jgi:pyruvate,water dikinase
MNQSTKFLIIQDEWNASRNNDYLWSSVNFGEAVTETMTPLTWSVIQFTLDDWRFLPGYLTVGNIGGTPYLNISIFATLFAALGRDRDALLAYMEGTLYMQLPEALEIPLIQLSAREKFAGMLAASKVQIKQHWGNRQLRKYLSETPGWFQQMRDRLSQTHTKSALLKLWEQEIAPHVKQGVWCVLGSVTPISVTGRIRSPAWGWLLV